MEEQKVRSIEELAPKPSDAIKAMLNGLRSLPNDQFQIDMGSFGHSRDGVCFGCAATCAVFQLLESHPSPLAMSSGIAGQARYFCMDYESLYFFEEALDIFRLGRPSSLFSFYGCPSSDVPAELRLPQSWCLNTGNWQEQLPMVEEYVKKLEAAGF